MELSTLPNTLADFRVISLVCITGPCDEVASDMRSVLCDSNNVECWSFARANFDLKAVYESVPPRGGAHLPKLLLWEPASNPGRTAVLSNYVDGMQRTIGALNSSYGRECFRVLLSRDYAYLPECRFEYFGKNGQHRLVEVFKDYKWEFRSEGQPREFEDVSCYARSVKKTRLTFDIIISYLCKAGWNMADEWSTTIIPFRPDESFWRTVGEAVMVSRLKWGGRHLSVEDF